MEEELVINPQEMDAVMLNNFLNKKVEICIACNLSSTGWVKSIDPISKSFILLQSEDGKCCVAILVPGGNIKTVRLIAETPSSFITQKLKNVFKKAEVCYSKADLDKRREELLVWLSNNRVPHSLTSSLDIEVLDAAIIHPPYTAESINCSNEVVLDKVIKLVTSTPSVVKDD